jgi:hypothetical protein
MTGRILSLVALSGTVRISECIADDACMTLNSDSDSR